MDASQQANLEPARYNSRALVKCEASYLGAATPILTTQPPGIIHEPLEVICQNTKLPTIPQPPNKPVRLYIYHSAILIQILYGDMAGQMVFYPIQNLYCSAGLLPHVNQDGSYNFKTLEEQTDPEYNLRPVFSVVLRESINKKILQCHAFAVINRHVAKLLVQATAVAFKDKNGWNQPLNVENTQVLYTLNGLHESSGVITNGNVTQIDVEQSNVYFHQHWRKYLKENAERRQRRKVKVKATKSFPERKSFTAESNHNLQHMESLSYQDELLRSPSSASSSLATYNGFQTDLPITGKHPDSPSVTKSASISSGQPTSQSSASSATCLQISPQVVVIQKIKHKPKEDNNNNRKYDKIIENGHASSTSSHGILASSSNYSSSDSLSQRLENISLNSSTYTRHSGKDCNLNHDKQGTPEIKYHNGISENHGGLDYQKFTINNNNILSDKSGYPHAYMDKKEYLHPDQFMYGSDLSSLDGTYKPVPSVSDHPTITDSMVNGSRKHQNDKSKKKPITKVIPQQHNSLMLSGYSSGREENSKSRKRKPDKTRQLL